VCLDVTPRPSARSCRTVAHNSGTFAQFPLIIPKNKSKGKLSSGMKRVTYLGELLAGRRSVLLQNWALGVAKV
jgi:hypothetical protein